MTQKDVIDYIKENGSMTSTDAQREFNATNLSSVVFNINNGGEYKVKQELRGRITFCPNKGDRTVTHYVLEDLHEAEQVP